MRIYFAPLEGVTDAVYRRVHRACFGGVEKYFMPFVSPTPAMSFTLRVRRDFSPDQNAGMPAVPQILAKDAPCFLQLASAFGEMGYPEVNLNLGCPSGTVTGKGKGAAMLRDLDALRRFLDQIYAHPPLPISIKTRIGYDDPDKWPALLAVYQDYPVHELIVHPRTRQEAYGGKPHRDAYALGLKEGRFPWVYNGNLFTAADCRALLEAYPGTAALMLGRGLAANPALAQEACGGPVLTREALCQFHDRLYAAYLKDRSETAVVGRMHLIMHYLSYCFENPQKPRRAIRKATTAAEYADAVGNLFSECALKETPAFDPVLEGCEEA